MGITNWSRGRVLGRGSTAVVSLASSFHSCEFFAVKSAELARSEFLQREQRIHSAISTSPYVVSYLGFDITEEPSGSFYNLFLEYAPGGSLSDEIKKHGGLSEAGIRARTEDIVRGIAHLHSKGITHCDVKGQNVLVGCDGRAKIADFGCSRFVDGCKGKFMGTPMFMAPETARGEEQGTAADIWAVGCTVIEMATGLAPWPDATDAVSLLHRIAFTGDLPEAPEWLSEEGKDFLVKCLAREAKDRWTADELLRHPFLSSSMANLDSGRNWTSPKSTLDRSFWDSMSEEEEEVEEGAVFVRNCISELFSRSGGPEWTWDHDWLTVRVEEEALSTDESTAPAGTTTETIAVARRSTTISTAGTSEQDLYSIFTTNPVVSGRLQPVLGDNCDVISSRDCDHNVTKLLLIANWIFPLVPVVTLLLSCSSLFCCLQCFNSWIKVIRPVKFCF